MVKDICSVVLSSCCHSVQSTANISVKFVDNTFNDTVFFSSKYNNLLMLSAPSDSVFRTLCAILLTYLLTY